MKCRFSGTATRTVICLMRAEGWDAQQVGVMNLLHACLLVGAVNAMFGISKRSVDALCVTDHCSALPYIRAVGCHKAVYVYKYSTWLESCLCCTLHYSVWENHQVRKCKPFHLSPGAPLALYLNFYLPPYI